MPTWTPGDRCSIAVLEGGYRCRYARSRFTFGTVLLVSEARDPDLGALVVIALADGAVSWRYAADVHGEWHFCPEAEFRRQLRQAYRGALREEQG